MPNIIEYNAPANERLQPSDIGETSKVRAAVRISEGADQTGQRIKAGFAEAGRFVTEWQDTQVHKDMANGYAALTTAQKNTYDENQDKLKTTGFTDQPDALKQLDDNGIQKRQSIIDAATNPRVRDALTQESARIGLQEHEQHSRDLINVSKAQTDIALNQLVTSQTGLAAQNPASMMSLANGVDKQLADIISTHPNMSAVEQTIAREKYGSLAKGKIIEAGLGALALQNPGAAERALASLPPDLAGTVDGTHVKMLAKEVRTQDRQNAVLSREQANLARVETARKTDQQFAARFAADAKNGQPPDPSITQDAYAAAAKGQIPLDHAKTISEIAQSRTMDPGAQVATDQTVLHSLEDKMFLEPGDPNRLSADDITKANIAGRRGEPGLSDRDADRLHTDLMRDASDPVMREALGDFTRISSSLSNLVNPSTMLGQKIPGLATLEAQYMNEKRAQFRTLVRAGADANEILNDPSSKNYLFKDMSERLSVDQQTAQQLLMGALTGGVKPEMLPFKPAQPVESSPTVTGDKDLDALIAAGQKARKAVPLNPGGQ